ncbi:chemotaxis protein CheB [Clostridium septicum]|uniref:protein-glutamate methylesterase n=1 Tax=Clostridium septicum TaxID=1504 RepID=A0A9N7JK47_CLOSE|nr:chemotaxis protein CheB [Clostridium septicum]QAS61630.1 chemotaxis protein CheB [Clostridium septicum]
MCVVKKNTYEVIVIGASTGGPKAIEKVLKYLPYDLGVPVLIVQHMPRGFTKSFADRLNKCCNIRVLEATTGMKIEKNTAYIAPGGYHMEVESNNKIYLNEDPAIWGVRPAVDKLFESASKVYKKNVISVILTGMGRDGANGTKAIKEAGGTTISEDESTCTIYGMPKMAYETGAVDFVLPLHEISNKLKDLLGKS